LYAKEFRDKGEIVAKTAYHEILEEGIQKGKEIGLEEGKEIGLKEGVEMKAEEIARKLLDMGQTDDFIINLTGITKEKLDELKNGRR